MHLLSVANKSSLANEAAFWLELRIDVFRSTSLYVERIVAVVDEVFSLTAEAICFHCSTSKLNN